MVEEKREGVGDEEMVLKRNNMIVKENKIIISD